MADTQHQYQVDHLKDQIDRGARETKTYLDQLKKRVEEYDEKHPNAQKATEYLCAGIEKAQSAVEELVHVGKQLSSKTKDTSDRTMKMAQSTLANVKRSLDVIQNTAREYDDKFFNSSGASAVESVESIANSARQSSTTSIEMANEQLARMTDSMQNTASSVGHGVKVAAGEALLVGDKIDAKLGASEKASNAAGMVTGMVKNLDNRMHVTETAAKIDSKVTGGLGARVVNKGVEIVQESIDYVTETLQQAKIAASKSGTAQAVDEKAGSAIDAADATALDAKEKMVSARDTNMGSSSSSPIEEMKEGASRAKDTAAAKASYAKDTAAEKASHAKDTMGAKAGSMKQDAQEMADSAQTKGSSAKGSAEQGAQSAKEKALEKAHATKEEVREMAGTSQQTGREAKQGVEQTSHGVMETIKDFTNGAKEAVMGMAPSESATDQKRKQGGQGEPSGAAKIAEGVKEQMADMMSKSKAIMKESTKA